MDENQFKAILLKLLIHVEPVQNYADAAVVAKTPIQAA